MTGTNTTSNNTAATVADQLELIVNLLRAHPDLPAPCVFAYASAGMVDLTWQLLNNDDTRDDQRSAMQDVVRALGGTWKKSPWDDRFDLKREADPTLPDIRVEIYTERDQVCERVVVGTETVTIPATEAVDARPERTEIREVVEWRCDSILTERDDATAVA